MRTALPVTRDGGLMRTGVPAAVLLLPLALLVLTPPPGVAAAASPWNPLVTSRTAFTRSLVVDDDSVWIQQRYNGSVSRCRQETSGSCRPYFAVPLADVSVSWGMAVLRPGALAVVATRWLLTCSILSNSCAALKMLPPTINPFRSMFETDEYFVGGQALLVANDAIYAGAARACASKGRGVGACDTYRPPTPKRLTTAQLCTD